MSDRQTNYTNAEVDLYNLWSFIKRRWQAGLSIAILGIVLSAIAAYQQKDEYTATGKLLFKLDRAAAMTGIGEEFSNMDSLEHNANPMITEIEVVKSVPIAEQALADLQQKNLISPSYSVRELLRNLSVEPIIGTDIVTIAYKTSNAREGSNIVNELMETYLETSLANSRNDVLAAQQIVSEQLPIARKGVEEKEKSLQEFKEKYQIFAFEQESQSTLTKKDQLQTEIDNIQVQLQEARSKSKTLEEQLGMDLQQAIALRNISQSPRVKGAVENLSQLQNQIIEKQEFFEARDPTMISLNSQVESIRNFLESEINQIPGQVNRQFTVSDLQNDDRDAIQQDMTTSLAELEREISGWSRKLAQLQDIQQENQLELSDLPKIENEYKDLTLQLEAAQSNYRSLLGSLEEIRLAEQQNFTNVRIIESAKVEESYQQSILTLAFGTAMGLIVALSSMIALEINDKSIKTSDKLEEIFNYPILGTIPAFDREIRPSPFKEFVDRSVIQYFPKPPNSLQLARAEKNGSVASKQKVVEFYSKPAKPWLNGNYFFLLQSRLKIITEQRLANTIVVSSSLPQEGKSEIIAHLALNIANSGQTVSIVDANLRQPAQHEIWQLENKEGLSDLLLSDELPDLFLHRVSNNLDVLPSGKICDRPEDLLSSQKIELLLKDLSQKYDYVLIDSPPILNNADALNLGRISDGIILVARMGFLNNSQAIECSNLLKMTDQNIFGIVINDVEE